MTLRIYTLGRFSIVRNNRPLRFTARAQAKPLALLKALIANGGREVDTGALAASLWPGAEGDHAAQSFKTTLRRLRQLIGADALMLRDDKLSLDPACCWVDVWVFERLLNQLLPPAACPAAASVEMIVNQLYELYRGPFLGGEEASWALLAREHIRAKLVRAVTYAGSLFCEHKQCQQALTAFYRGLDVESLHEDFYRGVMRCALCLKRPAEGLIAYERCATLLRNTLGVAPSAETELLVQALRAPMT